MKLISFFHSFVLDCIILFSDKLSSGKNLKEGLVTLEEDLLNLSEELQQEAQRIPNMSHPDVPVGGEDCSVLRKMVFSFL